MTIPKLALFRALSSDLRQRSFGGWPITARLPLVCGALILVLGLGTSQLLLSWFAHEQELALRRLAAVYLDGISATILSPVQARDAAGTDTALRRALLFNDGIPERQLLVYTLDNQELAQVRISGEGRFATLTPALRQRLDSGQLVLDEPSETGWTYRTLFADGRPLAHVYAELDLKDLMRQRASFETRMVLYTAAASIVTALLGYVLMRRLLAPIRTLTARLNDAERGELSPVPEAELGSPTTEFGRLLRGFNVMVRRVGERADLIARLAEQDRTAVLGRLAATIAHEVRNPLGGILNAVDTVRKFGADPTIRSKGLNLVERGLDSIRDVVDATLATHRPYEGSRPLQREDLEDIRVLIQPEALRKAIALAWSNRIWGELPVDATKVRQLALNLVLNACAASPSEGVVRFEAEIADDELVITVADDGPGLPSMIATAITSATAGKLQCLPSEGMGIPVVLRLVADLGGHVEAGPNHGRGTVFALRLPMSPKAMEDAAE